MMTCNATPLHSSVVRSFTMDNGMYCVYGRTYAGVGFDVYKDSTRNDLVVSKRGIAPSFMLTDNIIANYAQQELNIAN